MAALWLLLWLPAVAAAAGSPCATRATCNDDEVCAGPDSTPLWVLLNDTGVCTPCSSLRNCSLPCAQEDGECTARSLAMLTDFDLKPPYYLQYMSSISKPVFTIVFFGLDKPFGPQVEKPIYKKAAAPVLFGGMALLTLYTDLKHVSRVLGAGLPWQRSFLLSVVVFLTSSNVASSSAGLALLLVHVKAEKWFKAHNNGRSPESTQDVWKRSYVGAMACYAVLLWLLYIPLGVVAALTRPAVLTYFFVFCVAYFINADLCSMLVRDAMCRFWWRIGRAGAQPAAQDSQGMLEEEQVTPEFKIQVMKDCFSHLPLVFLSSDSKLIEEYDEQAAAYAATGLPKETLLEYFKYSACSPLMTFFAPAGFLYAVAGLGYWEAMGSVLSTCHLPVFVSSSVSGFGPFSALLWWVV